MVVGFLFGYSVVVIITLALCKASSKEREYIEKNQENV